MTLYRETSEGVFAPWQGEPITQKTVRWIEVQTGEEWVSSDEPNESGELELVLRPIIERHLEEFDDEVQHPTSIEDHWTSEDLAALGLYKALPALPAPPNTIVADQAVKRVGDEIRFVQETETAPIGPRKTQMIADLAQRRWEAETGGITVTFPTRDTTVAMRVPTDERTQSRVDQVVSAFRDGDITDAVSFKMPWGVVYLGEADMRAIKKAGAQHIQSCFEREDILSKQIVVAADHEALDAIDFIHGWSGEE